MVANSTKPSYWLQRTAAPSLYLRETETETAMTETTEKERGMAMFHTLKTQSVLKDSSPQNILTFCLSLSV